MASQSSLGNSRGGSLLSSTYDHACHAGGTPAYCAPEVVLAAFSSSPMSGAVGPQVCGEGARAHRHTYKLPWQSAGCGLVRCGCTLATQHQLASWLISGSSKHTAPAAVTHTLAHLIALHGA
jgi:hypothetical protein